MFENNFPPVRFAGLHIVGGILFGLLETFAAALLPFGAENKRVFAFLVVILFLVFRPTGILGEKIYERV